MKKYGLCLESINIFKEAEFVPGQFHGTKVILNKTVKKNKTKLNKQKIYPLIIQSNNLWRKSLKMMQPHVTNSKHLLFSLNKNQGHINAESDTEMQAAWSDP